MTEPEFTAEWAGGPAFAEVAEALGLATDQIMAMFPHAEGVSVLATEINDPHDDEAMIERVLLVRDDEDILRVRERDNWKTWGELRAEMDAGIKAALEPEGPQ